MPQCPLQVLTQRAFLLSKIRQYFAANQVLEVETPILSSAGNSDIHIKSFTSQSIDSAYNKSYLRTSPEFALKRLLCAGIGDVYEIAKVFRQGEISKSHNIEFTLLEWYRLGFDLKDLIEDVRQLFEGVFCAFEKALEPTESITFYQCFGRYLKLDLSLVTVAKLNRVCRDHGYGGSELSFDEALDFLFATQIQPKLNKKCLTFVSLYPASQAALAQINPDDEQTALRFEVFYNGQELGNAYQELRHAAELQSRFAADNQYRKNCGLTTIEVDTNLIEATKSGMPMCSGIAVGIDRLLMVLLDLTNIEQVISFTADKA
jgi:lysyl-tRNA synthetase class 2